MALAAGQFLGPYQVRGPLGAGGMGEVYRAVDPRLQREVALKILPESLSGDPVSLARFEREARAVAALSHPNILSIHDAGQVNGVAYSVAELLQGRNLREMLSDGPLSPRKAVEIALQVAYGLAAAHDKGIVHRDLKPENLFVTQDGRVKILDFGLAQIANVIADSQQTTISPAASPVPRTAAGLVLGTVGYMAPEQLRGRGVDHRTDIFALGAVLYEMLSGQRAFSGESPADTMGAILRGDPPDLLMQLGVSPTLDRLTRRCLEKRPDERFQSARDLAFALEALSVGSSGAIGGAGGRRRLWLGQWAGPISAVLVALAIGTIAGWWLSRREAVPAITARFTVPTSVGLPPWVALSRDGAALAWAAVSQNDNVNRVWLRRLADSSARMLAGTEGTTAAAWLSDGRRLVLLRGQQVVTLDTETGSQSVVDELTPEEMRDGRRGLHVGPDDHLLIGAGNAIIRVSATEPANRVVLRRADPASERWLGYPQWLPDGDRFLYSAAAADGSGTRHYLAPIAGGEATRLPLPPGSTRVLVDPAGFLLYGVNGAFEAQAFDFARASLSGAPFQIGSDTLQELTTGFLAADVSPGGTLAYRSLGFARVQFEWVDRVGRSVRTIGPADTFSNFDVSPGTERIVVTRREPLVTGNSLWLIDEARGATSQLADSSQGSISDPTWSPDGQRLAYRRGNRIVTRNAFGGAETQMTDWTGYPDSWSRDGRHLAVGRPNGRLYDLWVVPTDGSGTAVPLTSGEASADEARFSPDGRFVAFHASVEGRFQVYVVPFPPTGERWQISSDGGVQPRWRSDGRELLYLDPDGRIVTVGIPDGNARRAGRPEPLFRTTLEPSSAIDQFDISDDGQRILLRRPVDDFATDQAPLTVIMNWRQLSRAVAP